MAGRTTFGIAWIKAILNGGPTMVESIVDLYRAVRRNGVFRRGVIQDGKAVHGVLYPDFEAKTYFNNRLQRVVSRPPDVTGDGQGGVTEGGGTPLIRRIPKRGFSNAKFETLYYTINVRSIDARFDSGAEVNPETLVKVGLIPNTKLPVKVLGDGEIKKSLKISATKFSVIAKEKIEKVGGTVTVLE
jgi:large subunit ribosomal protein L15